jgi:predicted DNA-binding transcriptional regulator YafY
VHPNQPFTLTDAEATAIALAAGSLETLGDTLKAEGRSASADLAYGHSDKLAAIYGRWALGRVMAQQDAA